MREWITDQLDTPGKQVAASVIGGALGLALIVTAAVKFWPVSAPDVADGQVRSVASFVMSKDFNSLSTDERLKYMTAFGKRYQNLTDDDAVELAEFIADMNYEKRKQIEENMKGLVFDYLGESAMEYQNVPMHEREAYLEKLLLDMDKMGDELNDANRELSDADRMARMRRQGNREKREASEQISTQVDARGANMLFNVYNSEISTAVPAVQRGAIAKLMLDMTKVRRGDSLRPGG